jgi:hypothetical protein
MLVISGERRYAMTAAEAAKRLFAAGDKGSSLTPTPASDSRRPAR